MLHKSKEHLDKVDEGYIQHMGFALRVSATLITAGVLLFLHALIPAVFQCSASQRIFKLADQILARQNCPHTQTHTE